MKQFLAVTFLFLISAQTVSSAETPSAYEACIDKAGTSDAAMTNCVFAESDREDERMNRAYSKLLQEIDPSRRKGLRDAQRAWLQFRDKSGEFLVNPNGGTLDRLMNAQEYLRMVKDRADELESILAHETL